MRIRPGVSLALGHLIVKVPPAVHPMRRTSDVPFRLCKICVHHFVVQFHAQDRLWQRIEQIVSHAIEDFGRAFEILGVASAGVDNGQLGENVAAGEKRFIGGRIDVVRERNRHVCEGWRVFE